METNPCLARLTVHCFHCRFAVPAPTHGHQIFMWIDQEEQQILEGAEGAENLSIMGRIKMFLAAPKLVQTRITQAPGNIAGNLLAATKRLSEKVDEVRLRNRVVGALNDSDEEDE